jgi:3-hydroxybutyryl-CoA dehydrogenase
LHSENIAAAEDIDASVKLGANYPLGLLVPADVNGSDVCLAGLDVFLKDFGDPKYCASPLLREMWSAGHLGRKTGPGVDRYE